MSVLSDVFLLRHERAHGVQLIFQSAQLLQHLQAALTRRANQFSGFLILNYSGIGL